MFYVSVYHAFIVPSSECRLVKISIMYKQLVLM
jgi:hypothetical protein